MQKIPGPDPRLLAEASSTWTHWLFFQLYSIGLLQWLFLALVGIIAALTGIMIDSSSGLLRGGI